MMNWKDMEGTGSVITKALLRHWPGDTSVRTVGISAEIRTIHFPNTI
jgi:hypothetical protein